MNGLTSSKSSQPVATHKKSGRSKEKRKSKHKLKKRVSNSLIPGFPGTAAWALLPGCREKAALEAGLKAVPVPFKGVPD